MREKRTAVPVPAKARLKLYNSPPPPSPSTLLLWAKQHTFYSSVCINVVREIAAYMTPLYLAGLYYNRLFIVNMDTFKCYFPTNKIPEREKYRYFLFKNRAIFSSEESLIMLELPSLTVTHLPAQSPSGSLNNFSFMRFYSECLYGYEMMWNYCIKRLHLKTRQWGE